MTKKTNRELDLSAANDLDAALAALHERLDAEFADIPAPTPGQTDFEAATRHDQFAPRDDRPISAIVADLARHDLTQALASEYAQGMLLALQVHKLGKKIETDQRQLLHLLNAFRAIPTVQSELAALEARLAKSAAERATTWYE